MLANLSYTLQSKVLGWVGWLRYMLLERYYAYTWPIGLVIVTIALTLISTLIITSRGMLGLAVLGAVAGLLTLVFIYNNLEFSALLLVVVSTMGNISLPRDLTTTLILLIVMLVIWLVKMIVVDQSFAAIQPAVPNRFVFLFGLAVIISYVWSSFYVDPNVSYFQDQKFLPRTLTAIVLIISPLSMLFYGNIFTSLKYIKSIVWFYIYFGCILAMVWIVRIPLPEFFNNGGQLGVWASLLGLGQLLFNKSLQWWQRIIIVGGIAAWGYVVIGLGISWLSGWVPVVLGFVIVIAFRSRVLLMLALVIVVSVAFVKRETLINAFFEEKAISGDTRAEAAGTVIDIAGDHFLFGTGPSGYYFYMMVNIGGFFQLTHNNYFDIFAQTGILGIVIWCCLWLSNGWIVWRVFRLRPTDSFVRGLTVSLVAIYLVTLVLMALGDWITPFTYTQSLRGVSYTIWPWMWIGITLALYHLLHTSKHDPVS